MPIPTGSTPPDPEPINQALPGGRMFAITRRPLLGDCAPSGRVRLDALARWLQDAAYADLEDSGLYELAVWVLRRTRIQVLRFPTFAQECELHTFCSAVGSMWAERRTTVTLAGQSDPLIEVVALWVHLDPDLQLPSPVSDQELAVYGASVGGRRVHARLRHPRPPAKLLQAPPATSWTFRHADADMANHVNNAAYWAVLEDDLISGELEHDNGLVTLDAEVEFRLPAQPGTMHLLTDGEHRWLVDPDTDELYASMVLTSAAAAATSA
ncbi:MAG: acyl-ACP thioesterase domain-containing protein [Solirubrobacteraceae bacterium]